LVIEKMTNLYYHLTAQHINIQLYAFLRLFIGKQTDKYHSHLH
jgi:hypothetical protein